MSEQQDDSQLSISKTNIDFHLRTKGLTDILDSSLSMYWRHIRVFGAIAAIYFVLDSLREGIFLLPAESKLFTILDEFINNLIFTLICGLCVVVTSETYLGKDITLRKGVRCLQNRFSPYIVCTLIYLIPFLLLSLSPDQDEGYPAIIALIVVFIGFPIGIYYLISRIFYGPVVVVEGELSANALNRSRDLVRGTWWQILWRIIGILVLTSTIGYILTVSFGLMFALFGLIREVSASSTILYVLQSPLDLNRINSVASAIMTFLSLGTYAFTTPIYAISVTLLYFDCRIRDEAFDIELRVSQNQDPSSP